MKDELLKLFGFRPYEADPDVAVVRREDRTEAAVFVAESADPEEILPIVWRNLPSGKE